MPTLVLPIRMLAMRFPVEKMKGNIGIFSNPLEKEKLHHKAEAALQLI